MIIGHIGNILDLQEGILVHGCNCLGVMGSGIAKSIKDKWPGVYEAYKERYNTEGLYLGDVVYVGSSNTEGKHILYEDDLLPPYLVIANAMTQYSIALSPGQVVVDYDAISSCFARIKILARETRLPVHFPLIGCGLANGKWEEVAPRIEAALGPDIEKHLWRFA